MRFLGAYKSMLALWLALCVTCVRVSHTLSLLSSHSSLSLTPLPWAINLQKFTLRGARQRIILAHIAHHTVRFARAALSVAVSFLVRGTNDSVFGDPHFSHL